MLQKSMMPLIPIQIVLTVKRKGPVSQNSYQYTLSLLSAICILALLLLLISALASRGVPIQSQRDALSWCYPVSPNSNTTLTPLSTSLTANDFSTAARGWSSWGIQADPKTTPSYKSFNQDFILSQCGVLASPDFKAAGYDICALDSGWSDPSTTDPHGRIMYKSPEFDLSILGVQLHSMGLKLGVYTLPGFPCSGMDKTIKGTDITLRSVWNGNVLGFGFCDFDFSRLGVQEYHDSVIELWTDWGVDMIKLDYMTPGSPKNNGHLVKDNSGAAVAYHTAIRNSGRKIRLNLSWKLCRADPWMDVWAANAESMRVDQDIDSYNGRTFMGLAGMQRSIENYRQFITRQAARNKPLTIHPDLDNLFVGNPEKITGLYDSQRITVMSLWIGASANLILGSDLTSLDTLGRKLITSPESVDVANFCAGWPMQPRNPGTGRNEARQLQTWISGPSDDGEAVVILTNLGADRGTAGYGTRWRGVQSVKISLGDLGLESGDGDCWSVRDVWDGVVGSVRRGESLEARLDEGESRMLWLKSC